MPTAQDVIMWMDRLLGYKYIFGGELTGSSPGNCDCSEAVEFACRNLGVSMPDGSGNQFSFCDSHGGRIPFDQARNTPGALIYKSYGSSYPPGDRNEGGIYHVACVKGPNLTTEVCCDDGQTIRNMTINDRSWYGWGTLIPNVSYGTTRKGDPDMILIKKAYDPNKDAVALVGLNGGAYITNTADLAEVQRALADPAGHIALVNNGTWANLVGDDEE